MALCVVFQVAVKIIDKIQLDEENERKTRREIEIWKTIDHPNILRLYQVPDLPQGRHLIVRGAQGVGGLGHLVAPEMLKILSPEI